MYAEERLKERTKMSENGCHRAIESILVGDMICLLFKREREIAFVSVCRMCPRVQFCAKCSTSTSNIDLKRNIINFMVTNRSVLFGFVL